jgi:hypothetical protein
MKLIGNTCRVVLKGDERNVVGILIDSDEHYDYVQADKAVFVIPKQNVLFYETDQLPQQSRVITAEQDKTVSVVVDDAVLAELRVKDNIGTNELVQLAYSYEPVQRALIGKKQKIVECFDDSIVIRTTPKFEDDRASFGVAGNPLDQYLSPGEMAARLSNISRNKE